VAGPSFAGPGPAGGYRGTLPPPPGQSGELPPGFLTGDDKQRKQRKDRRRTRLSLALGVLVLLVAVGATLAITARSNEKTTVADVAEGECFNGDDLNDVSTVDCDERHQAQLFAIHEAPDPGAAFPADTLQADADAACTTAFETFYGATLDVAATNGLGVRAVPPTEAQWNDGDTDSFCLVQDMDGNALQGSMEGKGTP
jgi:hypothetical protein